VPDVEVEQAYEDEGSEGDPTLEKAIEILSRERAKVAA